VPSIQMYSARMAIGLTLYVGRRVNGGG